jgi:hypothetical protein
MRIRLHGTEEECRRTVGHLTEHLDVLDVSRPYPDRPPSRLVRLSPSVNPPAPANFQEDITP